LLGFALSIGQLCFSLSDLIEHLLANAHL
jgi:hypothetical protein